LSSGRAGSNSYKSQKSIKLIVKILKNIVKIIQATVAIILFSTHPVNPPGRQRGFFPVAGPILWKMEKLFCNI
jgi:hypothetical protein